MTILEQLKKLEGKRVFLEFRGGVRLEAALHSVFESVPRPGTWVIVIDNGVQQTFDVDDVRYVDENRKPTGLHFVFWGRPRLLKDLTEFRPSFTLHYFSEGADEEEKHCKEHGTETYRVDFPIWDERSSHGLRIEESAALIDLLKLTQKIWLDGGHWHSLGQLLLKGILAERCWLKWVREKAKE